MKKKLFERPLLKIIPFAGNLLGIVFTIILFSLGLNENYFGEATIWSNAFSHYIYILLIVGFIIELVLFCLSIFFSGIKKKWIVLDLSLLYSLGYSCAIFIVYSTNHMFTGASIAVIIFQLLFEMAGFVFAILLSPRKIKVDESKEEAEEVVDESDENYVKVRKPNNIILLILSAISVFAGLLIFVFPLYTVTNEMYDESTANFLFSALTSSSVNTPLYIMFILFFLLGFISIIQFIISFKYFYTKGRYYLEETKKVVFYNLVLTIVYFLTGFIYCFISNTRPTNTLTYSTIAFIPMIIMTIVFLVYYVFVGRYTAPKTNSSDTPKLMKKKRRRQLEGLGYIVVLTIITFISLFVSIIKIDFQGGVGGFGFESNINLNGLKLLQEYATMDTGMQLLAFFELLFLLISGLALVITLVSYFSKIVNFNKVVKSVAIVNVILMFLFGVSGLYFTIGQKINEANILSVIETLLGTTVSVDLDYKIWTDTIYLLAASAAILVLMIITGQFGEKEEVLAEVAPSSSGDQPIKREDKVEDFNKKDDVLVDEQDYDVCPAFTEIDFNKRKFDEEYSKRVKFTFENPTLSSLTEFIVDYAKNSRLHLSYTVEDIATFIAGLGASRLSILQGMSGTGKTSLPKIFVEAIMGNCEIVEVESSWRDKNELLGYYNEFSKSYTPKKFTQSLYRATLNSNVPTLIVLDEMNLSRIEYYFSDFLSLMENEEDKREIKLLNVKLFRIEDGRRVEYLGLKDGHTISIPKNVWFVGTANRDESTFEISDKVYDRAQTMNFNKRAPKVRSFQSPMEPRFMPYAQFAKLIEEAKKMTTFDIEADRRVQEAERLLAPYNISFGNRVLNQMEEFIKIYCTCLKDKPNVTMEAVEKILLSKVVSKLEFKNVEDKESLAQEFDNVSLHLCSAFIRKLNED